MKQVEFNPKQKMKAGLDRVADAVKLTIGPKGKNVVIDKGYEPLVTNDGGTIANEIKLKDRTEDLGAQLIRGVVRKTSEKVGGGRTASAILMQAMVEEGLKHSEAGLNMSEVKAGMKRAASDITENLKKMAREVKSEDELISVATISTESRELGEVIGRAVWKAGKDCVVTVEEGQGLETTVDMAEGLKLDRGWLSPYMVTDPMKLEAVLKDVPVLVTDRKISYFKDIEPLVMGLAKAGKNTLAVFCEDMDGEALNAATFLKIVQKTFSIVAVRAPGVVDKHEWLEDVCLATGAELSSDKTGKKHHEVELGKAKKLVVGKEETVIVGGGSGAMRAKAEQLKAIHDASEKPWERDQLLKRMARLTGSVAVIKVGAATEAELKYLKQKVEDGVNEARRALEEGIVIGGNCSFIHARDGLRAEGFTDFDRGYNIVLKAVESPLRQIITNAGGKPDVIIEFLDEVGPEGGYNALDGGIADLHMAGIIDALKVVRTVLENAVSGAIMFLTVEAAVIEEPEEAK